jgi:predicted ATP-dependent endonuclease of OLD family
MYISKILIQNYKSIKNLEFDLKKYGNSYTTILVGINESGKSNILEAMSYFATPSEKFDYLDLKNQKDESNSPVNLQFSLEFEDQNTIVNEIAKKVENGKELLKFKISDLDKNVYLEEGEEVFSDYFNYEITLPKRKLFIKEIKKDIKNADDQTVSVDRYEIALKNDDELSFVELTEEVFLKYFSEDIEEIVRRYEPKVSFWKPSEEYLISEEDLNTFSQDINKKPALRNIFYLAGYDNKEKIQNIVKTITNGQQRSRLQSVIQDELNKYIKNIWKHDIDIVVDITETSKFTLSIKDSGKKNKHDRLPITGRSEGARHFISLILSLSIENTNGQRKNQLILIDEPEAHLHPSGIRDLRQELFRIGEKNYVFISTHSPFLVDRCNKERNIIIKKNTSALTEKIEIAPHTNFIDDEVLREAFGIEVYKDLLNPHSILVEGASDKNILQKAFVLKGIKKYGITNGHGSNIDTLAAKLNDSGMAILVILDDDKDGKKDKSNILKLRGSYSVNNVFTIRDLVGEIKDSGSIEDSLNKNYIETEFKEFYQQKFGSNCVFSLLEESPFIEQIKKFLQKERKYSEPLLLELKKKISDDFNPTKSSLIENFPLLDKLIENIQEKLN